MKVLSRKDMSKLKGGGNPNGGDPIVDDPIGGGAAACNAACDSTCKTSDNRDGNCRYRASDQKCFCVAGY